MMIITLILDVLSLVLFNESRIVCFRAVQLQWSLLVEPSSPVTSERL